MFVRPRISARIPAHAAKRPAAFRPGLESLEDRLTPAATTFVNDNWALINDADASTTLTAGDTVRNDNDTVTPGTITAVFGTDAFSSINAAITATDPAGAVNVLEGNYTENVVINKTGLTLKSIGGRTLTTITGTTNGDLGAVLITTGADNVTLGGTGAGFKIIGIDNPSPGIESAAVYYQGNHAGGLVQDNEIVANGEAGLLTEFGGVNSGLVFDNNIFSGQTFTGANPAGDGSGAQFTLFNVPRQLVNISGGSGGGNTSDITFTNNQVTGTAGGTSTTDNSGNPVAPHGQGNNLVTIDANGAEVTGNTFDGDSARLGVSFRARGPALELEGNTFLSGGLTPTNGHVAVQNNESLDDIAADNTFDKAAFVNAGAGTIGLDLQALINASPAGTVIHAQGTFPGDINVNKAVTIEGDFGATGAVTVTDPGAVIEGTISGLAIDAAGEPVFIKGGVLYVGAFGSQQSFALGDVARTTVNNPANINSLVGPDTADRGILASLTGLERFIQSMYLNTLGRTASPGEVSDWLATGLDAIGISHIIEFSLEASTFRVKSWYQQYLGRAASDSEAQGWVAQMYSTSEEHVQSGILGSAEFYARAQTLVANGTADERYVRALYHVVLNRDPGAAEVNAWLGQLASAGRGGIAFSFVKSSEFRLVTIEAIHVALLHRTADPAGALAFLEHWNANDFFSATNIRIDFETSAEYFANG